MFLLTLPQEFWLEYVAAESVVLEKTLIQMHLTARRLVIQRNFLKKRTFEVMLSFKKLNKNHFGFFKFNHGEHICLNASLVPEEGWHIEIYALSPTPTQETAYKPLTGYLIGTSGIKHRYSQWVSFY